MIFVKHVYDTAEQSDGPRFLVDHLWPRGVKKEAANVDGWMKAVSPGNELRAWFGHDPEKWKDFQLRYFTELDRRPESWQPLLQAAREGDLTLVFSAHDTQHNNAVALRMYLTKRLKNRIRIKRLDRWPSDAASTTWPAAFLGLGAVRLVWDVSRESIIRRFCE